MSNRKEMPKQAFYVKLKKGEKFTPTGSPLGNQVKGHP
jgi:hypothetical protein